MAIQKLKRNPIVVIGPSIGYIQLTAGQFALVDLEMVFDVGRYNWQAKYYKCIDGYYAANRSGFMHRYLMPHITSHIDHRNGNGLDNRKSNLRSASSSENQGNAKKPKHNKSGFKGVSWVKRVKKWEARIQVNGEQIRIGRYATPEEASVAYLAEAEKQFGKFARAA